MTEDEADIRCWVCGKTVNEADYDNKAGQCKECEKRNPMPLSMRSDFRWPTVFND